MQTDSMIIVEHVSMCFRMDVNHTTNLKEWAVRALKRQNRYESFWALKDISFDVRRGEILGIIGDNGAGKSTLLKVVSGILEPTEGNVSCGANIVPMLELGSGFDFELSGRENIFLNGAILGYDESYLRERYQDIVDFSELGSFIEMPIKTYSSGMMARLAFAVATIVQPEILIVDEILAVGDASFQKKSHDRMLQLMTGGATVLFVSHSIEQIQQMCSRVLWLNHGEVMMFGDTQEVTAAYIAHHDGL